MKKFVALVLGIVLLATMLVMTGCTKQNTVLLTVDGYDARTIVPATKQKTIGVSREEKLDGSTIYTINALPDGDYDMLLVDSKGDTSPFNLKIHNGKVEAEATEGITITATMK